MQAIRQKHTVQSMPHIKLKIAITPQTPPTVNAEPMKKINPYLVTLSTNTPPFITFLAHSVKCLRHRDRSQTSRYYSTTWRSMHVFAVVCVVTEGGRCGGRLAGLKLLKIACFHN